MPSCSNGVNHSRPISATAPPPQQSPTLSIWVIGNPTSGGRRGAVVLGKLAKLFQKTYGADAVQETQSSRFLAVAFPAHVTPASRAQKDADASAHLPSLDTLWESGVAPSTSAAGPTPPITPPSSPQAENALSLSAVLQVRTMIIQTDHSGHATSVSNALSRLILRSRLRDAACTQHHLVLVVGGDGTLSEVVNGLCEGTLAAYQHFVAPQQASTSAAEAAKAGVGETRQNLFSSSTTASSSYARVEQEAAVFSHLLPALLYVPGGTGADFAKLGLCCHTPEAALHVVRDGLAKALQRRTTESDHSGNRQRSSPACYGCPVDVGRIEFLSTGTRHFFINICSIGMSCDVIRRGERFKRSRLVSRLGGTLLFALSAFISLLLMTPKPLYLTRLPPRVTRSPIVEYVHEETTATAKAREELHKAAGTAASSGSTALAALAAFSPLRVQLRRLYDQLCPAEAPGRAARMAPAGEPDETRSSHAFSSLHGDSVYARASDGSAYACHAETPLPPPNAKTVQCAAARNASRDAQPLLDIEEAELRLLRCHLAQQECDDQSDNFSGMNGHANGGEKAGNMVDVSNSALMADASHALHDTRTRSHNGCLPVNGMEGNGARTVPSRVKDGEDDLSALTWVEMPSSMVAFANGRWYGGGMHVAPHANPTDGLLSCTNWVATVLPFISGVVSLYTGRHLRWRSTSAFDGERFLVTNMKPNTHDAESTAEPLFMEADGEVLESVPAIVELAGKITFIVPQSSQLCVGDPAPGTTRQRLDDAAAAAASQFFFSDSAAAVAATAAAAGTSAPSIGQRLRRSVSGVGSLWRRSWSYARRWSQREGRSQTNNRSNSNGGSGGGDGEIAGRSMNGSVRSTRRVHDGNADEYV